MCKTSLGLPWWLSNKISTCNTGDAAATVGSIPGLGRSPGEGISIPLQYPCLEKPTDVGAWQAIVRGVTRVRYDLVTKTTTANRQLFYIELVHQQ